MAVPRSVAFLARMKPEQMRVYQLAQELAAEVDKILGSLPTGVNNIAKHHPAVKASAFDIARKKNGESQGSIVAAGDAESEDKEEVQKPTDLANCLIGMQTVMIKQQEERDR